MSLIPLSRSKPRDAAHKLRSLENRLQSLNYTQLCIDPSTGLGPKIYLRLKNAGGSMITVTQLAKRYGISRTTILYYEREGLLLPATRTDNGYRWYGDSEKKRLETIISYRSSGMPVAQILNFLDRKEGPSQFQILKNHLHELGREIELLKRQQKAIITFLQEPK